MFSAIVFGLLASTVSGLRTQQTPYTMPQEIKAAAAMGNCTMPAKYTVSNFTTYERKNQTDISFHFSNVDTKRETNCVRNSTSQSSSQGLKITPRWPCDDTKVEFIYQDKSLTMIEVACNAWLINGTETSGRIDFNLDCTDFNETMTCVSREQSVDDVYSSLQPRPPTL